MSYSFSILIGSSHPGCITYIFSFGSPISIPNFLVKFELAIINFVFLKEFIKEKFLNKYQNLEHKFKKSEFIYLLFYRFIGGIPWQISCLLPTLFNVKIRNFFFATLIGIIPQIFLAVSIGSGFEKIIDKKTTLVLPGDSKLFKRLTQ